MFLLAFILKIDLESPTLATKQESLTKRAKLIDDPEVSSFDANDSI